MSRHNADWLKSLGTIVVLKVNTIHYSSTALMVFVCAEEKNIFKLNEFFPSKFAEFAPAARIAPSYGIYFLSHIVETVNGEWKVFTATNDGTEDDIKSLEFAEKDKRGAIATMTANKTYLEMWCVVSIKPIWDKSVQ